MNGVSDDAGLGTRETDGFNSDASKGNAQKRHGDALAGCEKHVHFTARVHV